MFSGEIDVDEMVEIFCLMYSLQVILILRGWWGDKVQRNISV
jgi:hypothetical protein